jgi:hypothetical protein
MVDRQGCSESVRYDIHMYNDYCIANHRSTVHQVRVRIYRDHSTNILLDGDERGHVKYHRNLKKVGDEIYYIYINRKKKEKPRESTEPENSNQKLITKDPAPKRDVSRTTTRTKTKYRLDVAGNSIIVVEEIVIVTWDMK